MEKRSTVTDLSCFTQYVSEAIDQNKQLDVVYTDSLKAFDQVDHYVLFRKLNHFGFLILF